MNELNHCERESLFIQEVRQLFDKALTEHWNVWDFALQTRQIATNYWLDTAEGYSLMNLFESKRKTDQPLTFYDAHFIRGCTGISVEDIFLLEATYLNTEDTPPPPKNKRKRRHKMIDPMLCHRPSDSTENAAKEVTRIQSRLAQKARESSDRALHKERWEKGLEP